MVGFVVLRRSGEIGRLVVLWVVDPGRFVAGVVVFWIGWVVFGVLCGVVLVGGWVLM